MRHHACHLNHATELDLPPAPTYARGSQGLHEVPCLRLQLLLSGCHARQLLPELRIRLKTALLNLLKFDVDLPQRLGKRTDQGIDCFST